MNLNIDPDTTPDTYIEHREFVRIGDGVANPTAIRIGSSTGATKEAPVNVWLGGGLPPMGSTFITDFTTRYMDPTEVKARFTALAAEFPNLATLVPLPNKTNGYQRKAQATLAANATTVQRRDRGGRLGAPRRQHDRPRPRDDDLGRPAVRTRSGARSRRSSRRTRPRPPRTSR